MTWNPDQPDDPASGNDGQGERSPQWLARVAREWRRVVRAFAYHPHVTVTPIKGDPPEEWRVDYLVTTLVVDDTGQLGYATAAPVHVWIGPSFPQQAPLLRPMSGLFHPNVSYEGIHPGVPWHAGDSMENVIHRVGDLLAWRIYDPSYVLNPAALEWMNTNAALLPLDHHANFSPAAGGEPLARVVRHGPASLETIRQSLLSLHESLLRPEAQDPGAVNDFAAHTRGALNLFLELDVPDALRTAAAELDDTARELPVAVPCYEHLRGQRAAVRAARDAATAVTEARAPLEREFARLAALAKPEDLEPKRDEAGVFDPRDLLGRLPDLKALEPVQIQLPRAIQEAERRVSALKARVEAVAPNAPPEARPQDGILGPRLEKELDAVATEADSAAAAAADALASLDPLLGRARADAAALEQVARWREYLDLVLQGRALEKQVLEWAGDGVQAYYVEQSGARHGPFQFEQRVELGAASLVVRDLGGTELDVRDPDDESVLGQSKSGEVTLHLHPPRGESRPRPRPGRPAGPLVTLRLTGRCDDLLVQFNFIRNQTAETLEALGKAEATSDSWCGRVCRALAEPAIRGKLERRRSRDAYRWRMLMLDLADLAPLKERIETHFLLSRASEVLPRWVKQLADGQARLEESQKRLQEISRRCERDIDTDQLIVPPKLAAPYAKEMQLREETKEAVDRAARVVRSLAQQLKFRLREPKWLGKPAVPAFRTLQPLPPALADLPLGDHDLGTVIVQLEALLKMPLGGPRPGPKPAAPPAAPPPPQTEAPPPSAESVEGAPPPEEMPLSLDKAPSEEEPPEAAAAPAPSEHDGPPPQGGGASAPPDEAEPVAGEDAAGDVFFVDDEEAEGGADADSIEDSVFWDPAEGEQDAQPGAGPS